MENALPASRAQLQLKIGFAFLCLGTLILHATLRSMPFHSSPSTHLLPENAAKHDIDLQAIQASIEKLSTALHNFHLNIAPLCSNSASAEADLALLVMAGFAVVMIWMLGFLVLLLGLHKISVAFQQRVVLFGVVAANCTLMFVVFVMPNLSWYTGLLYTSWVVWAGMALGVISGGGMELGGEGEGGKKKD